MKFFSSTNYSAKSNSIITKLSLEKILSENRIVNSTYHASNAWISIGGWQSWNPGYELEPNEKQLSLHCKLVRPFNRYLEMPGSSTKENKNIVVSPFITYFRWDDFYLCLVSTGNINNSLPPVQFIINRKTDSIEIELCDIGKEWKKDELQAEIQLIFADNYFELKNKLSTFFGSSNKDNENYSERFNQIQHLGKKAAGWESWYNHYSFIDEKLILDDLNSLKSTENVLNKGSFNNIVFQIDDGWEKALGNWEIRTDRFPNGLKFITDKIIEKGFIPGLWIAPFIIDLRSPVAKNHPDWILRNEKGKPVEAGFNPLWGAKFGKYQPGFPGSFYCLDISIPEVVDYLYEIIECIINEWGFTYLKLDFLYAGMINGKRKKSGASYEFYTKAINKITSIKFNKNGNPVTYLGCGAPFELSFKNFPLCRIGCDTYEHWENKLPKNLQINGRNSAYLNLIDSIGRAYWDKIIFANDPDVIFIRNENCSLSKNQKLLIATVAAIFGSQIMYSDDPAKSTSPNEINLSNEICEIFKKYENEEFSVKTISKNIYEIHSKSGNYNGILNLEEGYANIQ